MPDKNILIVDDDIKILRLLKQFFERNSISVTTAISSMDAEQLLKEFKYDLMILDVMLPSISGIKFAKILRDNNNNIPIVILSALSEPEDIKKGIDAGANEYLSKSSDPQDLLDCVNKLINPSEDQDEQNIRRLGDNYYNVKTKKFIHDNHRQEQLTDIEAKLFLALINADSNAVSKDDLIKLLPQKNNLALSIDSIIDSIRNKIEINPDNPQYLKTINDSEYAIYI
ncbi:MAG: response regulator transcription factor [Rickettsiaceae bacterium]